MVTTPPVSSPYWGSHICVTAVANMDIIAHESMFYGLDEDIVNASNGGGRHHHKHAIGAELISFGSGENRMDADLALSLGYKTGGEPTVIEKGYRIGDPGEACEYGPSEHGIFIKTSNYAKLSTNASIYYDQTYNYSDSGLKGVKITDCDDPDSGEVANGIHLNLGSGDDSTSFTIGGLGTYDPCEIHDNDGWGLQLKRSYIDTFSSSGCPAVTALKNKIYENGKGGVCLRRDRLQVMPRHGGGQRPGWSPF